jgi:UDP-glucose 4-epimerase
MSKRVLLTGGTGYIGSHTAVELFAAGHDVVIADDLSNSSVTVLDRISEISGRRPDFVKLDLRDLNGLKQVFRRFDIDAAIHFAARKSVGESVEQPLLYYDVNVNSLLNLLVAMAEFKVDTLVFSSSCTVYGQPDVLPVSESTPFQPASSPYGNTKQICEHILRDYSLTGVGLKAISLRYFNPVGAHESALIGELPLGVPNNLVPFITQTAAGLRERLQVFGDDYDTADGTAIRDYIHVVDLARAHVSALQRSLHHPNAANYEYFNVGTGSGTSVMEVIKAFEAAAGVPLPYKIVGRRAGDIEQIYADTSTANAELDWRAEKTLADMLSSAWQWQQHIAAQDGPVG